MSRARSIALKAQESHACPATALIRHLISRCREGKKDPNLVIKTNAAAMRKQLHEMAGLLPVELSYPHLVAAEQSLPDVAFRYAVVTNEAGKPILFCYFQLYTITARSFNLHNDKSFVKKILALFLNLRKARLVISGNALRTDLPYFCYDSTQITDADALETIAAIAEELSEQDDASAVILTGTEAFEKKSVKHLLANGYAMPWEDNVMEMPIAPSWNSLEDYVAALSRKYKTRANKQLAVASGITTRILTTDDLGRHKSDIARLFAEVIDKQPFVLTPSGATYIEALKKLYGDDMEIMGFFEKERLVAFYSAFAGENDYELFYVGFNVELNATRMLYFNILLAGLGRAIALKKRVLKLGRTSFDAKASLGAVPKQKGYLVKLHHIPSAAVKWFTDYFSSLEDGKWKLRSPLKEAGA